MSDENKTSPVPYMVYESSSARQERTIKRLWILCIVLFMSFAISNAAWIWYESQWQYVDTTTTTQEVTQDSGDGGNNSFVGGDYGQTEG